MNPESTETSTEEVPREFQPVPAEYGGILSPEVRSDASGNVQQEEKAQVEPPLDLSDPFGFPDAAERERWMRERALSSYVSILPQLPAELRPISIYAALGDVKLIEQYLSGTAVDPVE